LLHFPMEISHCNMEMTRVLWEKT